MTRRRAAIPSVLGDELTHQGIAMVHSIRMAFESMRQAPTCRPVDAEGAVPLREGAAEGGVRVGIRCIVRAQSGAELQLPQRLTVAGQLLFGCVYQLL